MSTTLACRGLRGAISIEENTADAIGVAVKELVGALFAANTLRPEAIASILFSATPDLDAGYPAVAARQLGLDDVPLLCFQEMMVPDSPPLCIRVLIHVNTTLPQAAMRHVYIGRAAALRPEWRWPRAGSGPDERRET